MVLHFLLFLLYIHSTWYMYISDHYVYIIDPQAQLPNVPSEPVEQISAEDLPEVPTEEPGGTIIQFCYYC